MTMTMVMVSTATKMLLGVLGLAIGFQARAATHLCTFVLGLKGAEGGPFMKAYKR